jgi:hypothetical protein
MFQEMHQDTNHEAPARGGPGVTGAAACVAELWRQHGWEGSSVREKEGPCEREGKTMLEE